MCIWGSNILEKDPEALAPNYWLYWNKESSELQILEHPIQRGGSRQKIVKRVKTDKLQNCELEVSTTPFKNTLRRSKIYLLSHRSHKLLPSRLLSSGLEILFLAFSVSRLSLACSAWRSHQNTKATSKLSDLLSNSLALIQT